MNPFALTSFDFLIFFTIFGALVCGALELAQAWLERSAAPLPRLTDPYAIGFLRAGVRGALQVAVVSLVNRGLAKVKENQLVLGSGGALPQGSNPLEHALLKAASHGLKPVQLLTHRGIIGCCLRTIKPPLVTARLVPDDRQKIWRRCLCAGAIALLAGFALTRIWVAWGQSYRSVALIVFESAVFTGLSLYAMQRVRTRKGSKVLAGIKGLFEHLERRSDLAQERFDQRELMLLAAVFGNPVVPWEARRFVQKMSPNQPSGGCASGGCGGGMDGGVGGCGHGGSGCGGTGCGGGG